MEHLKLGDSQAAIDWLDKTVQIDPDYAYAWYHKAATHGDLGQTDEAKAAIEAGLSAAQRSGDGKAGEELRSLQGSLA